MQQLDGTVLTVALPTMARDLGATATSLSLALTSYLLTLALFIPASGTLADRFGSRAIYSGAIGVFLLGSSACAQADTLAMLVAARFVQEIGGAMMVPAGRLLLLRSVAKKDMVRALSWLVMPALAGSILGPPLGGLTVTWLVLPCGSVTARIVAEAHRSKIAREPAGSNAIDAENGYSREE